MNFSIYINKSNKYREEYFINKSIDFLDDRLHKIYPKISQEWIDSDKVLKCEECLSTFTFFNRKHHCRACGHVYCGNCCFKYIKIPTDIIDIPKEKNKWSSYLKNMVYYSYNESLVCNDCYKKIYTLNDIRHIIHICEFLTLPELYKVILLDRRWYTAAIHCLSKFRNIQYKNILSTYDCLMILGNKKYLSGHSVWTKILLKSYITMKEKDIDYTYNTNIDCWNLMCSRKCKSNIDIIDIIDIIYYIIGRDNIILEEVQHYIYDLIYSQTKKLDISRFMASEYKRDDNIETYYIISYLINCFKLLKINNDTEIIIFNILSIFGEVFHKESFIMMLIFEYNYIFTSIVNNNNYDNNILKLLNIIKIYLNKTNKDYLDLVNNTVRTLNEIYLRKDIKAYKSYENINILYPFNTNYIITDIIGIKEFNSASKPVLLIVLIKNRNTGEVIEKRIILKSEKGLRKENIVSQLIIILQNKLTEQMNKGTIEEFEQIPTYRIIMITNELGIIEHLDNCFTLKSINQKNYTLQNYILDNNKNEIIGDIKERFAKSLAISSCLSYVLGLGDRHTGNIMVSKNGHIIHIDYGYILENPIHSSIFNTPIIRISGEMIDFLGGLNSEYYELFKDYIIKVFDIIRLYSDIITNYYHILGYEDIVNWELFKVKLEDRFLNGMKNKSIEIVLLDLIETSSNSYSGTFIDMCNDYGSKIKSMLI